MKKFHFTLILFLIIQSVFSQVELRVNENKRISLNDTLTITADISHLKNSYSDEEIFLGDNPSIELKLESSEIYYHLRDPQWSKEAGNFKTGEKTISGNERFQSSNGSDIIVLTQNESNNYLFEFKSSTTLAELFKINKEYLSNFEFVMNSTNDLIESLKELELETDSKDILLTGDNNIIFHIHDRINEKIENKLFINSELKSNLYELINDAVTSDGLYENSGRIQANVGLQYPIFQDFNADGFMDVASRIYLYYVGDVDVDLTENEKNKLITRWALFNGTSESTKDSLVFTTQYVVDEKSESSWLHSLDLDSDGDLDIFTKSNVWHGPTKNRPKWWNDSSQRHNHIYINDGSGNFSQDSLTTVPTVKISSLIQLDSDSHYEIIKTEPSNSQGIKKTTISVYDTKENGISNYTLISTNDSDRNNILDYASMDVNNDGFKDVITLSDKENNPDFTNNLCDANAIDKRTVYLDVYYGDNDGIDFSNSNRTNLYQFETSVMLTFEDKNMYLEDFNNRNILFLDMVRNGCFYGDRVGNVPAAKFYAFEILNNNMNDVTDEIFPNKLGISNLRLGSDLEFKDLDGDGDIDMYTGEWLKEDEGTAIFAFINNSSFFIPKYFPHYKTAGSLDFSFNDVDGDGKSEMIITNDTHLNWLLNQKWMPDPQDSPKNIINRINFEDFDIDGVEDYKDNCPNKYNPNQEDSDGDGFGDVCDNYEDTFSIESSEIIEDVVIVSSEFQQLVDNEGYNNYNRNYFGTNNSYDYKDFNGDGFKDLIIVSNYQPEIGHIAGIFLWNNENKKYEDLTSHIMISRGDAHFYGKTVYDFDDDGDLDVYLPSHNYHGEDGKQPDYYFEEGQRFPGHYFINEGDKFYRKMIDSLVVDHGNRKDYPAFDQAFIIDLNNNGKKDLISVVMNSGYIGGGSEANFFFNKYSIDQSKNISKEFIFPWNEDYRYDGQAHSLLVKEDDKNIYVYTQPKELWINNGSYSYPEVWIYKKDGKFDSKDPQKIKLKRNKNLRNAGSIINRETFYIEDLDGDGNQEIIIGMFKEPFENGEHASLHVFDFNGNEITDTWFNEKEFMDSTGGHANGFVVKDFNNDGFSDLVVNARFNSENNEIPLLMNTGKKFKKFNINKVKNGWHMPVDIDNDSIYEFLTFNSKDDPADISSLVKINYSGFDNDNDDDGIINSLDNCPDTSNPDQKDIDGDGIGDVCDDSDGDGILDLDDQCPFTNPDEMVNENGCSETDLNIDNSSGLVVTNNQIGNEFLTNYYSFEIQEGDCPSTDEDIANGDCFNCTVRYLIYEDNYIIFDYNNDGKKDLFAFLINGGEDGINGTDENPTGKLMFYENYLSESSEPQYFDSEIVWGGWLDVNDFNGDGIFDILVTGNNAHEISKVDGNLFENIPFEIFYFNNDGFSERKVIDMDIASSDGPMSGDIDKDGDIDIIQSKSIFTGINIPSFVLLNDGNGNFTQNYNFLTEESGEPEQLTLSDHGQILFDINKDGCLDWILPVWNGGEFVVENNKLVEKETGSFESLVYVDGKYIKSGSRILWGDCSGNYSYANSKYFDQHQDYLLTELSEYTFESLYGANNYNVLDFNNDGINDIILAKNYHNKATGLQLFKGNSDGSYTDVTQDTFDKFFFKNSGNNGDIVEGDFQRIWNIAVKDKDNDGDLDLIPWGMGPFMDRCWNEWLTGEEYWEFVDGKYYFRSDKDLDGVYDHLDQYH